MQKLSQAEEGPQNTTQMGFVKFDDQNKGIAWGLWIGTAVLLGVIAFYIPKP